MLDPDPAALAANRPTTGGTRVALADRSTPLIRNCWYVAAGGAELGESLLRRTLLGQDVLLYRTAAGEPVALQNRCAHRSFPLHRGRRVGDGVMCLYHGITYGPDGRCTRLPADDRESARRAIAIHRYPVIERGPWVWLWTGDPAQADVSRVPTHPWLSDSGWAYGQGYVYVAANYLGLHENLLDTTHFSFLHAGNVGTLEYATAPYDVKRSGAAVQISRMLADSVLPKLYDEPMGLVNRPVDRYTDSNFLTPGWHAAHAQVVDRRGDGRVYRTEILHAITPESADATHYWWAIARDYAVDRPEVTAYMERAIVAAFAEDREALEWIHETVLRDVRPGFHERSARTDRAGLDMRLAIARLAADEATPAGAAPAAVHAPRGRAEVS